MTTWSERFAAHLVKRNLSQLDVVIELRTLGLYVTQSQVHYWAHGSRPREDEHRERIAKWSKGAVPANAPRREAKSA
jgi:hypothetical protein